MASQVRGWVARYLCSVSIDISLKFIALNNMATQTAKEKPATSKNWQVLGLWVYGIYKGKKWKGVENQEHSIKTIQSATSSSQLNIY